MLGLNNIQIIGNLGGTPDLKFLNEGKSQVVNFSVAVNERWKNRDGDPQERTTWLRVVAFNGIGQACAEHLTKGDGVYVEGRLQIREYEDKAKAEGKAEDILRILDKRGIALTTEQRERILGCTDLETLNGWFDAALDATSADEIFA